MDQSKILISYKSSFLPLFVDPEFALQTKSQNKLYNESLKEGGSVNFLSKHSLGPLRLAWGGGQYCISWYPNKGEASRPRGGAQVHMQRKDCAPSHICILGFLGGPVVRSFVRRSGPRKWGHHYIGVERRLQPSYLPPCTNKTLISITCTLGRSADLVQAQS